MEAIQKILFPTDFSPAAQNAFRYCLKLADAFKAEIQLLHVIYPQYEMLDLPVMATRAMQDKADVAKNVMQSFVEFGLAQSQMSGQLSHVPVIRHEVELGSPAGIINAIAKRDDVDIIVMGTKGEHNLLEKLFGSVTTEVIKNAPCSIWVVPEHSRYEQIQIAAYATNLNEADPYHIWKVCQLLDPFSPIMHCIHVNANDSLEEAMDFSDFGKFFEYHAPTLQINFHALKGSIVNSVQEFSDNHDVDLLVMYAPHHGLFEQVFHKSQTRRMAFQTSIPLLLFRPS